MRCFRSALLLVAMSTPLLAGPWIPPHAATPTAFQRGAALGLFAWEADWDYAGLLDEIVAHGATDVELVIPWTQNDLRATEIEPLEHISPSDDVLRRTIRQAHQRGLRVMLFPIIRIIERADGEWRGKMEFTDSSSANAWWRAYGGFIGAMARIAADERVARLSIGSELLRLEKERPRWAALISQVRKVYPGKILYSANWDHYGAVTFWDLVDEAGMTAYFELTSRDDPSPQELSQAWERWLPSIALFAKTVGRPVVFTEIGYPSLNGANKYPWDETRKSALDMQEQSHCYRSISDVVAGHPAIQGIYLWNWFGPGGDLDGDYTPRGKPASAEMRRMYQTLRR